MKPLLALLRSLAVLLLLAIPAAAMALEPDQILMIVNKNVPAGKELAEFYAQQRHVPDGRICELDLATDELVNFDDYERKVVPPVRDFLRKNHLEGKVTCLLTFYGVPLRILNRASSPAETQEVKDLEAQLQALEERVTPVVEGIEQAAGMPARPRDAEVRATDKSEAAGGASRPTTQEGPATRPVGWKMQALNERAEVAMDRIVRAIAAEPDADKKKELDQKREALLEPLIGPINRIERQVQEAAILGHGQIPAESPAGKAFEKLIAFHARFDEIYEDRFDPAARAQGLKLIQDNMGPFDVARAITQQLGYLATDKSGASFENELALLWWGMYSRSYWLDNPLHYANHLTPTKPVMMTMRLDAPDPIIVRRMIIDSVKTELDGLHGQICIDSRGLPGLAFKG